MPHPNLELNEISLIDKEICFNSELGPNNRKLIKVKYVLVGKSYASKLYFE